MSKHNSKQSSYKEANQLLESVSGPIRFNMTNDYMFKEVLQENNHVLKSLIADLLRKNGTKRQRSWMTPLLS